MRELISVIIPVYNVERYLPRCLESVCASRYTELEIICINDGSTDGSPEMLNEWAQRDKRICVIHTENRGLSMARNAGLDLATGAYVAFVDSDDYVSEYYFELLLQEIKKHDAGIAVCSSLKTSSSEDTSRDILPYKVWVLTKEEMLSSHKTKSFAWGKLYRRDLLKTVRFIPDLKIEDAPFNVDVARKNEAYNVVYLDTPLYFYFARPGSLVTKLDADDYLELHEYYAECGKAEMNPALQRALLTESVKRGLTAEFRYWMERENVKARRARSKTLSVAWKCRKHRLIYSAFICFPAVYKMYLTMRDPTIRNWKRKAAK